MKKFKRLFKIFLGLLLLFIVGVAGPVIYIVITAPLERMEKIQYSDSKNLQNSGVLESGALVSAEHLKFYLMYANLPISVSSWIKHKISSGSFRPIDKGKRYFVHKRVHLPEMPLNDCQAIYCIQRRLPFQLIPSVFWKGLIGIEDHRFLGHSGVDLRAIARAIIADLKSMRLKQGGSTITQQLAKNLFYSSEKSFSRKVKEIILSLYLEFRYSKERILAGYLNEMKWGSFQGIKIRGLYAASLLYFAKPPQEIRPFEAAILVALLKGPYYYSPLKRFEKLKTRSRIVFKKLVALNFFSSEDKAWNNKKWKSWLKEIRKINAGSMHRSFWQAHRNRNEPVGDDFQLYEKFIFTQEAFSLLEKIKAKTKSKDISVKALFGNTQGQVKFSFYSKFERNKQAAIRDEHHNIGSTLKPILYSFFFSQGKRRDDLVSTKPLTLELKSGKWSPREAHKNLMEEVTLEEALLKSYNRPIIYLSQEIGFDKLEAFLDSMVPRLKKPLAEYPAQLLGAVEMSVYELFQLYADFFLRECQKDIVDAGKVVEIMSDPKKTTISHFAKGGFSELKFFGKTGTSNRGHDSWFVAFDGHEIGIIWVGLEGNRNDKNLPLYGSTTAFKVF